MAKTGKKLALGTAIAAGIGYVAGILTAPKAGKETRKDIQDAAVRTKTQAEKNLKKIHSELNSLIDEGTAKAKTAKNTAQAELKKALETAGTAKEKVRVLLSAIHEGDADDKDLQKAIKDAGKAIDHLKTFLVKDSKDAKKV
jgi:gas vesicle protein